MPKRMPLAGTASCSCFPALTSSRWRCLDSVTSSALADFFETMREWAQGKTLLEGRRAIFAGLRLTAAQALPTAADEKSTPSATTTAPPQSLYPEPGQHGVFWMTPWLLQADGGGAATSGLFRPLLEVHQGQ